MDNRLFVAEENYKRLDLFLSEQTKIGGALIGGSKNAQHAKRRTRLIGKGSSMYAFLIYMVFG